MTEDIEPAARKIGDEWLAAVTAVSGADMDATVTNAASVLSIAISLRRIADVIAGSPERMNVTDGIMHAIEQGLIAGRNG